MALLGGGDDQSGLWKASGMGMELTGAILGGALVGWLIDKWLGSAPTGVIIGLVIGMVGGGLNFVRAAMRMNRRAAEDYRRRKAQRGDARELVEESFPEGERKEVRGRVDLFGREDGDSEGEADFPEDFDKW